MQFFAKRNIITDFTLQLVGFLSTVQFLTVVFINVSDHFWMESESHCIQAQLHWLSPTSSFATGEGSHFPDEPSYNQLSQCVIYIPLLPT